MTDRVYTCRVRLLLAKHVDDEMPVVVAAVDQGLWEHWDEEYEQKWVARQRAMFGPTAGDYEWRQAWATFGPDALMAVFELPEIIGGVES